MPEGIIGVIALLVLGYFMEPVRDKITVFLDDKPIVRWIGVFFFFIFPILYLIGAMLFLKR